MTWAFVVMLCVAGSCHRDNDVRPFATDNYRLCAKLAHQQNTFFDTTGRYAECVPLHRAGPDK